MNQPLVTVLMPVYNGEQYLRKAIDSILTQTYTDFELLIVNDGSTDKSLQIANSFKDDRIKIINQSNTGVSIALNNGLKQAKGKYIARMDADDICKPERLEVQMRYLLQHPECILLGTEAEYIDEQEQYVFPYKSPGYSHEELVNALQYDCPFLHISVIFLKSAVINIGGYNKDAYLFEDYFLWTKLVKFGNVACLKENLISCRLNPSSVTLDYRDYSKEYWELKKKAIRTGFISEEDAELMRKNIQGITAKTKLFSYHSLLSKKYLWNNYQPKKARANILKALNVNPFAFKPYIFYLFSFLPKTVVFKIYNLAKPTL
jgi:glycosyltransferase involved in cell wall biosynthesis